MVHLRGGRASEGEGEDLDEGRGKQGKKCCVSKKNGNPKHYIAIKYTKEKNKFKLEKICEPQLYLIQ